MKNILIVIVLSAAVGKVSAQDTTKRRTIDITSTFKPVLREAAKVNFNAAPVTGDSAKPKLTYNIPAENLLFAYQPADLKPVSLNADSLTDWGYSNFIKLGIGNVHQPYLKAGFSFGDGENMFFNVFAEYFNSKGDKPYQKNSLAKVGASMTYKTPKNLEWNAGVGFSSNDYYLYGFKPDSLKFTKDQLKQRFQTIEGHVSLRNIVPTDFGLSYNPSARISVMTDNHDPRATEANSVFTLPLQKNFGKTTAFNLGLTADLTNYRNDAAIKKTENNNIFSVSPAVLLKTPNLYLQAGLTPSWDRGDFHMLPNAMADITTDDQRFTLQLGLIGYYDKGSYTRYASVNPWLAQPDSLKNTRVTEGYVGFKGSAGNHFSYSAKVGFQQHRNLQLFINDTLDGKTFNIVYENKLNIFQTHAEAEYRVGEKLSAKAVFNWNIFNIKTQPRAWGIIPIELTTTVRYEILKDLFIKGDLWTWDAPAYRGKNGVAYKNDPALDVNAGAEFRINKNFNVWLQMNNLFNNKYQRWNQYPVFGFNILGGLVYSFNQ
ncbi:MAG: hypothetical protein H0X41_06160 [Chitinophagaceae bacterium]|nr:hypothetical protein [Chitinophagaceae bacterium]